jgi:hypothetical protein
MQQGGVQAVAQAAAATNAAQQEDQHLSSDGQAMLTPTQA